MLSLSVDGPSQIKDITFSLQNAESVQGGLLSLKHRGSAFSSPVSTVKKSGEIQTPLVSPNEENLALVFAKRLEDVGSIRKKKKFVPKKKAEASGKAEVKLADGTEIVNLVVGVEGLYLPPP